MYKTAHDLFTLLNECSNLEYPSRSVEGLDQDNLNLSRFVNICSSMAFFDYAFSVFARKSHPNLYLYNTMIKALSLSRSPSNALSIYNHIQRTGLRPNSYSFRFVLKAVVKLSAIQLGREIHGQTVRTGLEFDVHVAKALLHMYGACKCISDARKLFEGLSYRVRDVSFWNAMLVSYAKVGDVHDARALFEHMSQRDVVSWTALITGYAQMNLHIEAISIFRRMLLENVEPDEIAMLAALSACADSGALQLGEWIHSYIYIHGLYKSVPLNNALIDMYAKSGNIEKALHVFENMKIKTVITWTTMIAGLALHGLGRQALDMFSRMERDRIEPNDITFIAILSACSHVGLVELGRLYFKNMKLRFGIEPKVKHYGCMIDLLSRAGYLEEALELLRRMPFKANATIWGSLLAASSIYGEAELGERALLHLIKLEPHNSGNYALLSNLYASLGRWNESGLLRKVMRDTGVKKMRGSSCIEVSSRVLEFVAGDSSHPDFDYIYPILCKMRRHLKISENLQKEFCGVLECDEG